MTFSAPTFRGSCFLVVLNLAFGGAPARANCPSAQSTTTFCVDQNSAGVPGEAELGDRLGAALAFGDFDDDGRLDLAVGVPGENRDAGAVHVFFGDGQNLVTAGSQLFTQDALAGETAEPDEEFGAALAAGDFDDDGFDDLAIGAPLEDRDNCITPLFRVVPCKDDGVFHVVPGSPSGLVPGASRTFSTRGLRGSPPGAIVSDDHSRLGAALAALDVDDDGFSDLAVGMPGFNFGGVSENGGVFILHGSLNGLTSPADHIPPQADDNGQRFGSVLVGGDFDDDRRDELAVGVPEQEVLDVAGAGAVELFSGTVRLDRLIQLDFGLAGMARNDHFGAALAVGDFDGDGFQDLAIGTPEKNNGTGNPDDSGRVYVVFGTAAGLNPFFFQIFGENSYPGQTPQEGDRFGAALAAGDLDDDGFDDLLIGAPGEASDDRGFVYILRGAANGLRVEGTSVFSEPALGGTAQSNAQFGSLLAMGDVGGDDRAEIAIGIEDEDVDSRNNAGTVYVTRSFQQ